MKEIYVNIKIVILTPSQNQTVCNMAMEKNICLLKFDENCSLTLVAYITLYRLYLYCK